MSKDTTIDRAALQRAANLVKPAIAPKAYIPANTHIKFTRGWALAFNDVTAISVRCDVPDLECLVPGALLVSGLASFGGKEILVQRDEGALTMKSGRSKVKLPIMPLEAHPFEWPKEVDSTITLEDDMLDAIKRCLVSVNNDDSHPAQRGVTLDPEAGKAVFFSTDNKTVSRAACKSKVKLPGDVPIILPKFFCEILVELAKQFDECAAHMAIGNGWLEVQMLRKGELEARLFTRMPVDVSPMDFPKIVQRHCGDVSTLKKRMTVVPDELDGALDRALLVLGGEVRKKATLKIDDGTLKLRASSDLGDSDDSMKIDADDIGPVTVEADLLGRGLKLSSRISFTDTVTILSAGEDCEFLHIVAHVRST